MTISSMFTPPNQALQTDKGKQTGHQCVWTFYDDVPPARRQLLVQCPSFENVIGGLMLQAEVIDGVWEPFTDRALQGCFRVEFLLRTPSYIYDLFFNSTVGYRAQYAISPDRGERRNREVIDALRGKLVTYASRRLPGVLTRVEKSLEASAAKIWIYEPEVQAHYFDDTPEIDFARWRHNSSDGAGLRAPFGTKLVVSGGWLDCTGQERVNPYKAGRSQELYEVGFT